jgi:hypothetical protein
MAACRSRNTKAGQLLLGAAVVVAQQCCTYMHQVVLSGRLMLCIGVCVCTLAGMRPADVRALGREF